MGRAPAYWSKENVTLITEKFIPLSVYGSDQNRKDAVGRFYRDAGLNLNKVEAIQCCITASGKVLQVAGRPGIDLKKALGKWSALPDAERAPGAVKVPERGVVDPNYVEITPPVGGLIFKAHTRAFMRNVEGKLRYAKGADFWFDEQGNNTLKVDYQEGRTVAHEAQPHHVWLTQSEWKSLITASPMKGDVIPMPKSVTERMVRWHLNPLRFYGRYTSDALDRDDVRSGELTLTVDDVAPNTVRLRLTGHARLGKVPPRAVVEGKIASLDQWGYEPRVFGFLEYDPRKQVFTRFDIVALGDHFGRLGNGKRAPSRLGLQPLGIAFELVEGDQPADRVPPGRPSNSRNYFDLNK